MDELKVSHDPVQLNLFQPPPTLPRWSHIPMEIREAVCQLLAQMLSANLADRAQASQQKEPSHE